MKKLLLAVAMLLVASVSFAVEGEPPDDLDKLQKESVKRFHISKKGVSFNLREGLSKPYPGKPEEAARAFLKEYHKMFKLSKDLSELQLLNIGGETMRPDVRFQRYYKGIPIYFTGAYVELDNENRVRGAGASLVEINDLDVIPAIKPDELQGVLEKTAPEYGPIDSTPSLLIYFVENSPFLAYQVVVFKDQKPYGLIVDSSTGRVLKSTCTVMDEKKSDKGSNGNRVDGGYLSSSRVADNYPDGPKVGKTILLAGDQPVSGYLEAKPYAGPPPVGPGVQINKDAKKPESKIIVINGTPEKHEPDKNNRNDKGMIKFQPGRVGTAHQLVTPSPPPPHTPPDSPA